MSFGDPNNPYGQQAPQGQPGYGYPQQPPQGQPGYGYPQAPPVAQPYGGYPGGGYPGGAPEQMPGGVKAARIMLFVLGGIQAVMAVIAMAAGAWIADMIEDSASDSNTSSSDVETATSIGTGIMVILGIFILAFAAWGIMTAVKFSSGRNGIRISAIVYSALTTVVCLISLLGANIFALLGLALAILVIVFVAKSDGGAWFNRPRY